MTARIQVRRDHAAAWSAVNPTLATGEFGYETDTGVTKMGDGETAWASLPVLFSSFSSYTPTVAQGTNTDVSKTVTYSKYTRNGAAVSFTASLALAAAGDDSNAVTITLPTEAVTSGLVVGQGYYWDASGNRYPSLVYLDSTTTAVLLRSDTATSTQTVAVGVDPNIATASGDIISFSCVYEAV